MSSEVYTYYGLWVNWSHGLVRGTTLTLSQRNGGFLAAFLVLYVGFAGGMFWRILSFTLHQLNTTDPSHTRDWLHHQRQVILRNSGMGSGGAAWSIVSLPFSHSRNVLKLFLRCFPFAILAAGNLILFGVAGIFTSTITTFPGNSTLIRGDNCGGYQISPLNGTNPNSQWISKFLADTVEASTYVRQCYGKNTVASLCGTYVRSHLPFTTSANASCPFASRLCRVGDNGAFSMDTGFLDSRADFGINSRQGNRVLFRRVTTCAPITGKLFASISNRTALINAGPAQGMNATFAYSLDAGGNGFGYTLQSVLSFANSSGALKAQEWSAVPQLKRTDGDVTLIMLAQNDVLYSAPSDDPWISAHERIDDKSNYWLGDTLVSLMGCVDQYQICNPNRPGTSGCTNLSSGFDLLIEFGDQTNPHGINSYQDWIIARFLGTSQYRTMNYAIAGRGASALNVQNYIWGTYQGAIPSNQWQKEVTIWFQTCLAKEQAWAVEWATSPRNLDFGLNGQNISFQPKPPFNSIGLAQCSDQVVHRSGEHQSFSVLGISIVFAVGGLIILLGLTIDRIVGRLRVQKNKFKKEQWDLEETLELHRATYAQSGSLQNFSESIFPPSSVQRDTRWGEKGKS